MGVVSLQKEGRGSPSAAIANMVGKEHDPLVFSNESNAQRLPLWRKLTYGIGGLAYSMCNTVIGFYLTIFLLEVALLDVEYVLVITLLGRVWDGITDPVVGYLCGKTKTKLGQFRPWILLSMLPLGIAYTFLWYAPGITNQPLNFLYYICLYFAVQSLLTCVHVPYTALNVHMSYNKKEVDSVTLIRLVFEVLGTMVGILVYTLSYFIFVKNEDDCEDGLRERSLEKERAYRYHAVMIAVIILVSLSITYCTAKEQKEEVDKKGKLSFFGGIKETFGFKPYRELILLTLFSWLGLQFCQGNFVLYIKYGIGLSDQYPYIITLLLVFIVLWMPFWQIVMKKFGKKIAFKYSLLTLLPGLISLLYINYFPMLIYPLVFTSGAGLAGIYLMPWSMLPDVVDAAYLEKGVRREELFYAFFVFGIKCGAGLSIAASTGVYKIVGYDQLTCDQPWAVPMMFKILVAAPPVICVILSLFFLERYPITEKDRDVTAKKLRERRKNEKEEREDRVTVDTIYNSDLIESEANSTLRYSTLKGGIVHSNTSM